MSVGEAAGVSVEDEQAGQVALGEGRLRDALGGERVIELGKPQSRPLVASVSCRLCLAS